MYGETIRREGKMEASRLLLLPVIFAAGAVAGHLASDHHLIERMDDRLERWVDLGDDMPGWKKPLVLAVLCVRFPTTIGYSLRWAAGWRWSRDANGRVTWHRDKAGKGEA